MRMRGYSFSECVDLLNGKRSKVLSKNTSIERYSSNGDIFVMLHKNPIVMLKADGTIMISTCGYNSVTTRRRINQFLIANNSKTIIFQQKGKLYLKINNVVKNMVDGYVIMPNGDLIFSNMIVL
jgi:hypothetical protein